MSKFNVLNKKKKSASVTRKTTPLFSKGMSVLGGEECVTRKKVAKGTNTSNWSNWQIVVSTWEHVGDKVPVALESLPLFKRTGTQSTVQN